MTTSFVARSVGVAAIVLSAGCGTQERNQDLIGTWQRLREDATVRDQYTFGADGTFAFDELKPDNPSTEDHLVGTYQATDRTVVAEVTNVPDGQRARLTFSYYASSGSFSTGAFLPAGAHAGIIGTWQAAMTLELLDGDVGPQGAAATYEYAADGTFHGTESPSDGSPAIAWQGSYAEDSPGIFTATGTTTGGAHRTTTLQLWENAALVGPDRIWLRK